MRRVAIVCGRWANVNICCRVRDTLIERFSPIAAITARNSWYCGRRPDPKAPPKTAPAHAPCREAIRTRCRRIAGYSRALCLVVDCEAAVALPMNRRRERLHWIVMLRRGFVFCVYSGSSFREGFSDVAARRVWRINIFAWFRIARLVRFAFSPSHGLPAGIRREPGWQRIVQARMSLRQRARQVAR